MGLFEQFPWTNFDRLNLDALIAAVKKIETTTEDIHDRIETLVPQLFYQALRDGTITVALHEEYNATTRELTLSVEMGDIDG